MGSNKTSLLLVTTIFILRKSVKLDVINRYAQLCGVTLMTGIKATSHSTIFDIPMRPLREDQKHRHRFTR